MTNLKFRSSRRRGKAAKVIVAFSPAEVAAMDGLRKRLERSGARMSRKKLLQALLGAAGKAGLEPGELERLVG